MWEIDAAENTDEQTEAETGGEDTTEGDTETAIRGRRIEASENIAHYFVYIFYIILVIWVHSCGRIWAWSR